MTGFADAERNRLEFAFGRNNSLKEFAQSGKRVGPGLGTGESFVKEAALVKNGAGTSEKL